MTHTGTNISVTGERVGHALRALANVAPEGGYESRPYARRPCDKIALAGMMAGVRYIRLLPGASPESGL